MEWIEKYKTYIGIFLVLMILAGTGILLWQKKNNQSPPKSDQTIRIDIAGAVNRPGVYSLKEGSILEDVINAAGGLSDQVDGERLAKEINRAKILSDGEKIFIPTKISQPLVTTSEPQVLGEQTGKININTANQAQLESLPAIGPTYAKRIIEYRQAHGGFKNIEEIMNVKGIGQKTFEKIKDLITI